MSVFNDDHFVIELKKLYLIGGVVVNKTLDQDTCENIWRIINKNFPKTLNR